MQELQQTLIPRIEGHIDLSKEVGISEGLRGLWEVFTFAYDVKGFPFPYLHFPESQQTFAIIVHNSYEG